MLSKKITKSINYFFGKGSQWKAEAVLGGYLHLKNFKYFLIVDLLKFEIY